MSPSPPGIHDKLAQVTASRSPSPKRRASRATDRPSRKRPTTPKIDLEKLRGALQTMSRDELLTLAYRAVDLVPRSRLAELLARLVRVQDLAPDKSGATGLLDAVRKFHGECMAREYYDSFGVNSKNFMEKSEGTEAFIAELNRLVSNCVRLSGTGSPAAVRQAFELLLELLRTLDEDPDSIVFFADEAGSWQVGVDWRTVLPAYLGCLAATAQSEEFARLVDGAIEDFASYERPKHIATAGRVASPEQKAALARASRSKMRGRSR